MELEKKIAQMFIVRGDSYNSNYGDMDIGGYFLNLRRSKEGYSEQIKKYKDNQETSPFFTTDLEGYGYFNALRAFYDSKVAGEVETPWEAYELGSSHADILKEIGFNWNFSPVVERNNNVWPGRSFTGTPEMVDDKIRGYIRGTEDNGVMATAKHYPGGTLIKNTHIYKVKLNPDEIEYERFNNAINAGVSSVMISQAMVNDKQSPVDEELITDLRNRFDGLIVTDEIAMLGLRWSYFGKEKQMIKDLILAGNDVVLYSGIPPWMPNPKKMKGIIDYVTHEVEVGNIPEERINDSFDRIMDMKKSWSIV